MTVLLTVEDLLALVSELAVGPVRDVGLLDSAAHRPGAGLYGRKAYPELNQKAAALLDSVAGNHALVDDHERLAWLAVVVFYGLNQVDLDAPDDSAYELVMSVARRESIDRGDRHGTVPVALIARRPKHADTQTHGVVTRAHSPCVLSDDHVEVPQDGCRMTDVVDSL